jgi:hypothetical protein
MNIPFHMIDTRPGSALYCSFSCTGTNAAAPAFGRFPSAEARPTFMSGKYGASWDFTTGVTAGDKVVPIFMKPVGVVNGWVLDGSHHPDLWYVAYFMSDGDYYYYSELISFALYLRAADPAGNLGYQRHGWWAVYSILSSYQPRGYAWAHRTLGNALTVMDQKDPAYEFVNKHWEYDARVGEGMYEITNGNYPPKDADCKDWKPDSYAIDDMWCFGKLYVGRFQNQFPPTPPLYSNANTIPIPSPKRAANKPLNYPINFSTAVGDGKVIAITAPWQAHFKQLISYWNEQRGFTYESAIRAAEVKGEMKLLMSPGHNKWLAAESEWPIALDDGQPPNAADKERPGKYITTTAEWRSAWLEGHEAVSGSGTCASAGVFHQDKIKFWRCSGYYSFSAIDHRLEGYGHQFRAAAAGYVGISTIALDGVTPITGQQVWDWVNSREAQLAHDSHWNEDPRYAILPYPTQGQPVQSVPRISGKRTKGTAR